MPIRLPIGENKDSLWLWEASETKEVKMSTDRKGKD
jgi:hypothetical protein